MNKGQILKKLKEKKNTVKFSQSHSSSTAKVCHFKLKSTYSLS